MIKIQLHVNPESASTWARLAAIYSNSHIQHDSMPFFSLASCFMTFLFGDKQKPILQDRLFGFFIFLTIRFTPFLVSYLLQWLNYHWACFQFKNILGSIIEIDNVYHGVHVAKCCPLALALCQWDLTRHNLLQQYSRSTFLCHKCFIKCDKIRDIWAEYKHFAIVQRGGNKQGVKKKDKFPLPIWTLAKAQ